MIYEAVRDSWGLFGQYWQAGQNTPDLDGYELTDSDKDALAAHFVPATGGAPAVEQESDRISMAQLAEEQAAAVSVEKPKRK